MSKKMADMTELEKTIYSEFKGTLIPEKLTIDIKDNKVIIELDGKMIVEENMQVVCNAFEGWAIASHICSGKKVVLLVNNHSLFPSDGYIGHGHFNRFIYRIMKFTEQYSWFSVETTLNAEIDNFSKFLDKKDLVNNIPTKEAEETDRISDENSVEAKLAENGILRSVLGNNPDIGEGTVYRQLPVGLFYGEKTRNTSIFTSGHSAIDLWKRNGKTLNVIELKYKNSMIGIITEIFFYSNYMLDLLDANGLFKLADSAGESSRGYNELEKGIGKINGIMLADRYHPCVDCRCLFELNQNNINDKLKYYKAEYRADVSVDIIRIEKG